MKFLNKFKWLITTKLGWFILSFLWLGIFLIISENIESDWAFWVAMLGFVYMIGLLLIMMTYAFFINPLREYKELKNKKK